MNKRLIKVAAYLHSKGLTKEASQIRKIAGNHPFEPWSKEDMPQESSGQKEVRHQKQSEYLISRINNDLGAKGPDESNEINFGDCSFQVDQFLTPKFGYGSFEGAGADNNFIGFQILNCDSSLKQRMIDLIEEDFISLDELFQNNVIKSGLDFLEKNDLDLIKGKFLTGGEVAQAGDYDFYFYFKGGYAINKNMVQSNLLQPLFLAATISLDKKPEKKSLLSRFFGN